MAWPTTPAVGDMYTTLGGTKFVYTAQGAWKAAPTTGTTTDASGLLTGTLNDARLPAGLHALTSDSVVTNLNTAKSTGNFSFGPTASNAPFADYGQLEVFARDANNLTQIAYKSGNVRYIRDCTGGVFGSWVPLYGTAAEIIAAMDGKCLPQTIMAPGSSDGSRRYMRLASVNGQSAVAGAAMTFLMANAGDYGTPRRGTAIIHFTERADTPNVQVFQLDYENIQEGPIFYTVRTATYQFELWALFADYNHPINMYPLSTFNGTILGDSQTTTAPANLLTTYVFQNNIWHGGNFNPATKANLASPTFTGVPAAPTASAGTNTTQIATTAFVTTAIASVSGGAPASHTHVIADVTGLQTALDSKQGDLTYIRNLELAGSLSGDGHTYIDLHASGSVDYSARVLREGGVNGSLFIQNSGTGYIIIDGNSYFTGSVGVGNVLPSGSFKNSACIALGDGDTGIRQNGDGVLELWANNVNRATVTSTGMALTGTPTAPTPATGDSSTKIATTAFVTAACTSSTSIDPWAAQPIGAIIHLDVGEGITPPPTDKAYRYIDLTAGLTGAGGYNNGVLTSESVSGSSPNITATAVVSLAGSPLNGKTIHLLNTERRFIRPGSAGTLEDSSNLAHNHGGETGGLTAAASLALPHQNGSPGSYGGYAYGNGYYPPNNVAAATISAHKHTINSDGGTEARPRNIGVKLYRRIK